MLRFSRPQRQMLASLTQSQSNMYPQRATILSRSFGTMASFFFFLFTVGYLTGDEQVPIFRIYFGLFSSWSNISRLT
jgi:hypothetical protein